MRLAVHTDQAYRRDERGITTARSFVSFLGAVGEHCDELVVLGRLVPEPGREPHALPDGTRFVCLADHGGSARPLAVLRVLAGSCRAFWRGIDRVDTVWLLGPNALSFAFALLALVRGRRVVLGVRQDLPAYARARHPGSRATGAAASLLDGAFRLLARRCPVVAVGPQLAARYDRAGGVHETWVSLVASAAIADEAEALERCEGEVRRLLAVTRLDEEKNPLLLAEVLNALDRDWTLTVCGDGPLRGRLEERLTALGLSQRVHLAGEVQGGEGLLAMYRSSDALLHISLTEGLPQVLLEAFSCGTPVVATDVGGVAAAATGAAVLVPPSDAAAICVALRRLDEDRTLRRRLVAEGLRRARAHTLEGESEAAAAFIAGPGGAREEG